MPAHPLLDVVCRDGMFLPVPGGVYFHPGQTPASVDQMALVRAMNATRQATGGPIFVPRVALDSTTAMQSLGRALSVLDRSHDLVLVPVPGERPDPDAWLRATETAGVPAHLPPAAVPPSAGARIVPVGPDDRETGGTPVALRVLPDGDASTRALLRTAARLAADMTTTPLQRVRDLGAATSPAYPLAVGMVLTGSTEGWDPARLTPPTTAEIWETFRGAGPAPDDLAGALLSAPGSAALVRVPGLGGDRLTWLFAEDGTIWATGPEVGPASPALLAGSGRPGALATFLEAARDTSVPQITITPDEPVMPGAVGGLRAGMDRTAPAHPAFGPDYFGARKQAPTPAFARPLDGIRTGQLDAFFRRLDLTGRAGPVSLDGLPETGTVLRNAAGQEMPTHVPMIWVGSPVSPDNPAAAAFMAGAAQQARALAGEGYFTTLWVTEPPTAAGLEWARDNGIRVIPVQDVYHASNPVDDAFLVHLGARTVDGYTAAADVLRWRIVADFGGFYSDGDNAVEDAAAFAAEVRTLFERYGWAIHEGAYGRDGKRRINNSGILGARHHPAVREFRELIADNHATRQSELMAPIWSLFSGYAGGVEVAEHRAMDMLRRPLLWTAGPQILEQIGGRLPGRHRTGDGALPRLRSVHMGHAASWYRPDPLTPTRSFTEAERPAVLAGLAAVLAWQLLFRGRDLYLPAVAPVVAGFPDPDSVWRELLEPFLTEPPLRELVRTVTDRVLVAGAGGGVQLRQVELPEDLRTAWGLDGTHTSTWQLGELMRSVRPAQTPQLRWSGLTEPGSADDTVHRIARLTGPERTRTTGNLPLVTAVLDARVAPLLAKDPVAAAAWARFVATAPGPARDVITAYHRARERAYERLGLDPRSPLLPSSATLVARLSGASPDAVFPDAADRALAAALATASPWADLLIGALDTLDPWDGTDPDCADRVTDVLRALGIPLPSAVEDAVRGRDRLATRMGGFFQEPATAARLTALRIGAVTPVWAVEQAHVVLVHRHDALHYTLVETQESGTARLRPFTTDRLPEPLAGTVRLLGDAGRALLQADLDSRAIVAGPDGSAAPASDRTVTALLDPGTAGGEPGMLRAFTGRPAEATVTVTDDSVDYFAGLADETGYAGSKLRRAVTTAGHQRRVRAREFVERRLGDAPLRRDLVDPAVWFYRSRVAHLDVSMRVRSDERGAVQVSKPLPLDSFLQDRKIEWLTDDLIQAGWTVTHGEVNDVRPAERRVTVHTLAPDEGTLRALWHARDSMLDLENQHAHRSYRLAQTETQQRVRVLATARAAELTDPARRRRAWTALARTVAEELGVPPVTDVFIDDTGAVREGRFALDTWTLTLDGRQHLDGMLSALVGALTQSERYALAVRRMMLAGRLTGQAEGLPASIRQALSSMPPPPPGPADVAGREWDTGSGGVRRARERLAELRRSMTPPAEAWPGGRLHRRLVAEDSAWRQLAADLELRYGRMPRKASDLAVTRSWAAGGSVRDWSGVRVHGLAGFTAHPLGAAGVHLYARHTVTGPDHGPAPLARRPPATGPLVVVDFPARMDVSGALHALRAQLPDGAVVELRPNTLLHPETVVALAAALGPRHRLTIGTDGVDLTWVSGAIRHFAAYGRNHRPALGPFAAHYLVSADPLDPVTAPTALADLGTARFRLGPGVEAALTVGGRLWIGEPGTEAAAHPDDPPVVVGTPGRPTPWHVWQTALDRVADFASAAGEPFAAENVRVHAPLPMPTALPDVSPDAIRPVHDEDRELFRWLFGDLDDGVPVPDPDGRPLSRYHLLDALADLAGADPRSTGHDEIARALSELARLAGTGTGIDALRRLLVLAAEAVRTGGLRGITVDRLRALQSPPEVFPRRYADHLGQVGLGWLAEDLRAAGVSVRSEGDDVPTGPGDWVLTVADDTDERPFLTARDELLGLGARHDHRTYRMSGPELREQARQWATAAHTALAGGDVTAWTALAHRLADAGGVPRPEHVSVGGSGPLLDSATWTLTLPRDRNVDRVLRALLHGLLRAEQHVVAGQDRVLRREVSAAELAERTVPRVRNAMLRGPDIGDLRVDLVRRAFGPQQRARSRELRQAAKDLDALRPAAVPGTGNGRVRRRLATAARAWATAHDLLDLLHRAEPRAATELWADRALLAAGSVRDWSGIDVPAPDGHRVTGLGRAGVHVHPDGEAPAITRRPPEDGPLVVIGLRPGTDPGRFAGMLRSLPPGTVVELRPGRPVSPADAVALVRALGTTHTVTIARDRLRTPPEGYDARHFAAYGRNHRPALGSFADHYRVGAEPFDPDVEITVPRDPSSGRYDLGAGTVAYQIGSRLWIGAAGTAPRIGPDDPEIVIGTPGQDTPWPVWQAALHRIAEFSAAAGLELRTRRVRVHRPEQTTPAVPAPSADALHPVTDADRALLRALTGDDAPAGTPDAFYLADAVADLAGVSPDTTDPAEITAAVDALATRITGTGGTAARRTLLDLAARATGDGGLTRLATLRPADLGPQRTRRPTEDLQVYSVRVQQPGPDAIAALLRRDPAAELDDALFAIRMATPGVHQLTGTDPETRRAWADTSAALAGLRNLPAPDAWSRLPELGIDATLRRVARLVPDGTHLAAQPLLALDAVLRTGVFPDHVWPAPAPVHRLGAWTTQPRAVLDAVDAYAARAGRPVVAVDLAGPPEVVTPVIDRLRELLRWYGRIGPAPLVVGSRATAYGLTLFEQVRAEQRPVALTTEMAGWRLRDTDGNTVGELTATPARKQFEDAATLSPTVSGSPVALREWLSAFDPAPAEAYHRENWERLHDPAVATALDRLAEAHPDDTRLAAFRTALAVARRAGGPIPATGPRPAAASLLEVEPPWTADRGRVPVTVVYDYLRADGDRRARVPWDGLLFALMLAGELTDAQALSLPRATAVTGHDLANLTMMTAIAEIRALPDRAELLDADPLTHPRLKPIFDRIGRITKGGPDGSYRDCLSPDDRVAWVGRLDAYAKRLAASGDPFQRLRADLIGAVTYAASNC
ncbi:MULTISPECIES: hypothetical protein [Catenuloplanes]|uniref:Uncharacterized protein n=1 Tax=Catenuloplanes niger TaxID=587534 RepID=A0AAE3ZKZ6_9ACTN|nr:hypothetical protein [Catenuloplanes niger]MDR7320616.1 hypothetical protein [Catenuloplanes niger]